jgi:hypothetical protein
MVRRRAAVLALALLVLLPATAAAAAPQPAAKAAGNTLVVRIVAAKVELNADGTVSVPVRARCSAALDAFELDVSVLQAGTFGSVNLIGTEFPACTGQWQRTTLTVSAEAGTFGPGPATVSAFLGAFDPVAGSDLSAEDSVTVGL